MKAFTEPLKELGEFESIRESLKKKKGMTEVQGCIDAQKAHFIYGCGEDFPFRVIVTYSELRARKYMIIIAVLTGMCCFFRHGT